MEEDPTAIAAQIHDELSLSRSEFHGLLAEFAPPDRWSRQSANRAWTNGQLLFHIGLGFFVVVPLFHLMRLFAALPPGASRLFARCLDAGTPLFNRLNALGPRMGARVLGPGRLGRTFDAVLRRILRNVGSVRATGWRRGMHYPRRWEPRFEAFMTFETLFHYPTTHMRHHATQLRRD